MACAIWCQMQAGHARPDCSARNYAGPDCSAGGGETHPSRYLSVCTAARIRPCHTNVQVDEIEIEGPDFE